MAVLSALLAVREGMRLTLEHETRVLLREEATELQLALEGLYPNLPRIQDEFSRKVLSHHRHGWFAALFDENDEVLWKSDNFPPNQEIWLHDNSVGKFTERHDDHQFIVRHGVQASDESQFLIVLGEPDQFIQDDVWNLTKILLFIGVGLIFVAPFGGYLLARNATQPVREIIETTRSLNPARLDDRLMIRNTGDELDQISSEINSFLDQISNYLRSHREFVANAAHELRSPLTAIQTSVDVCLERDRTVLEYRDELATVSEQCQQIRYLVNQLLELAETDVSPLAAPSTIIDLSELVEKSMEFFGALADERKISINSNIQTMVTVFGHAQKLRQIVNNILDNALKFAPKGGRIDIELTATEDTIELVVQDTGPGVPAEELNKIFDRFHQVDSNRRRDRQRGNGLGLSICKAITEIHDGTIVAENREPTGLRVCVRLPRTNQ